MQDNFFSKFPSHNEVISKSGKLKNIDKKLTMRMAKKLSVGFEDIDTRKKSFKKADLRRAQKVVKEWYGHTKGEKFKVIKVKKADRKYYADYADMGDNFKIYAMPITGENDSFSLTKIDGKIHLKISGDYSDRVYYPFSSTKNLVKNPKKETYEVFKKIDKNFNKKERAVKIKCGAYEYQALYTGKDPYKEIEKWIYKYGSEKVEKFCLGFNVYSFKNQEKRPSKGLPRKGDKKSRKKK